MLFGVIKYFVEDRGFGFIKRDDGQRDVFVHIQAAKRHGLFDLRVGDRVSFDLVERAGKVEADCLRRYADREAVV